MKFALIFLAVVAIVIASVVLPVRAYLDFQVIYHADLGLLRGITLYDHAGQVNMIAVLAHVPPSQVIVLPFPYPPWYALSTLWLARLPIEVAARAWFGLSLGLLLASIWALTAGLRPLRRLPLLLLGLMWIPALGSLFVGQYGFPVLFGAALMIHALRRESGVLVALAAALLTFKPHLGAVVLLLVFLYVWMHRDHFGRALIGILTAALALFVVGFLAAPDWPLAYYHSLTGFRDVSQCHQCVSPPMVVAGTLGGGFGLAVWVAAVLALLLLVWLFRNWRRILADGDQVVVVGVLVTLVVSPYLQNYDYVLLIVPLMVFARDAIRWDWVWLALGYVVPIAGLALLGTQGNDSLVLSTLIVCALAARRLARSARTPVAQ